MIHRKLFWLGFLMFLSGGLALAIMENELNGSNIFSYIIATIGLLLTGVSKIVGSKYSSK
ncbi:hypothetical protein [Jeotgalibacillus salarius]|uniref:Uncharacterized protein n=1 Tax=Jeotgalibacillus salarius TaxID=546023 RepID=A0A4Y8LFC7_9BACL|nr:hypothetical protein [Jeotgalibacillus salarius]TFE01524.1 hypothetical protein E2626_08095 [Jeotgalibacillus salarius]